MISACLVVYNEEMHITRCLQSLAGVVDEIIVVHDGPCGDNTLKIAKTFGAKTFVRPRVGEAEPHRQFSFDAARGDWVLQIDADEFLSDELRLHLKELTQDSSVDAYSLLWEDPDDLFYFGIWPFKQYKSCLFRKSKIIFTGLVHEQAKTSGRLSRSEFLLHHRPKIKTSDPVVFKRKTRQWGDAAARTLISKGLATHSAYFYLLKAPLWGLFYLFYYLFVKGFIFCGKNGRRVTRVHMTYNFWRYYCLYEYKSGRKSVIA